MADNFTNNISSDHESTLSCDLTGLPSFLLQFTLGVIAFSTLLLKRCREPLLIRRPVFIWMADSLKQAVGMLGVHFVNLFFSQFLPLPDIDRCIIYLLNFLFDSTFGILIIYLLFKLITFVVNRWEITPLKSGEYGKPFKPHYWLAQCIVVVIVMLIMKLLIGPLVIFKFWKEVGHIVLPIKNKEIRTAIVIFIVPFIVNVLMFWIVDSIIMRKQKNLKKSPPTVSSGRKRPVYLPLVDRERRDDEDENIIDEHSLMYSDTDSSNLPNR